MAFCSTDRVPQVVAHRGYMAKYPENTMIAFHGAIDAKVDAIETDVRLANDGTVIISHDKFLKRIFGAQGSVEDLPYRNGLDKLRTINGAEGMPTLCDVLRYIKTENAWVLLDIKLDNDVALIQAIKKDIIAVDADFNTWRDKILLGIWHPRFLPHCAQHLPELRITNISLSLSYSKKYFLHSPQVQSFNLFLPMLYGNTGEEFIQQARDMNKSVFVWTVNNPDWMKWSIHLKVDGVLTNDPPKFKAVLKEKSKWSPDQYFSYKIMAFMAFLQLLAYLFWRYRLLKRLII